MVALENVFSVKTLVNANYKPRFCRTRSGLIANIL